MTEITKLRKSVEVEMQAFEQAVSDGLKRSEESYTDARRQHRLAMLRNTIRYSRMNLINSVTSGDVFSVED